MTEQEQFIVKLREHYTTPKGVYSLLDFQDNLTLMGFLSRRLSDCLEDATPYTLKEIINKEGITLKITEKSGEND